MLLGVLTVSTEDVAVLGLAIEELNAYAVLADNAESATVFIACDLWIRELPKTKKELSINVIMPDAVKLSSVAPSKSRRDWTPISVSVDDRIGQIQISEKSLVAQKIISFAITYELKLPSRTLDLSLHAASVVSDILHYLTPQQQPIPISDANIWLAYNNQLLRVFADKPASESRLSGSDLSASNSLFPPKQFQATREYTRLLWHVTRPSLNSPFYLNAFIQHGLGDETTLNEIRVILDSFGIKIRELETNAASYQQEIAQHWQRIVFLIERQQQVDEELDKLKKSAR